ncbi:MAG: aspartate/methionine/tyrosine aminotransferase [Gammaproteobacteria bacterium]|jgi:aspartate/methionine/tyrosine aminotransferase
MNFNPNVIDCAAAPIAEAWSWVKNRESDQLIDMCQAVPGHLPAQSLLDYLGESIKQGKGATYTDIRGILPLREALAHNINNRYQASIEADDLMITAGCNQAFCSVIDTLCTQGDEVIVPLPCYFNHEMWLSIRGIETRFLAFNTQTAIPDHNLAASLINDRTRAIVLVTPNNPTGAIYSPECIEAFYQLAKAHNIALIVDETYRDFSDDSVPPHHLFQHADWRDVFIHLYSFSKVFSLTGYRTGAVSAGSAALEQMRKVQDCTAISAPHVGQLAALYGLQNLDEWKAEKAAELRNRAIAIKKAFQHPELKYRLVSVGAYFAYIEHPFQISSRDVVKRLIQEFEIVSLPGSYFGQQQEKFIRFAFANINQSYFDEVVARLIASQK